MCGNVDIIDNVWDVIEREVRGNIYLDFLYILIHKLVIPFLHIYGFCIA